MTVQIPNTAGDINIGELTEGTLEGKGVFDVFMRTVKCHIKAEFEANRIRGTDYANVYLQAMQHAMDMASSYTLSKAKMALELQLLEAQIAKVATDTVVATKQGGLIDAQSTREMANVRRINFEVANKLPEEIEQIRANIAHERANTDLTKVNKDIATYELMNHLPKKTSLLESDLTLRAKEILLKEKQIPLLEKDILLKQNQIDLGIKELNLKTKQLDIAEAEVGIKEKELEIRGYELQYKLPADVALSDSQKGLYTQKTLTEKAQTDGNTAKLGSVIYYQNDLLKEQAKTYERDALQKTAKLMIDTWSVRHNADTAQSANADNELQDTNIGAVVRKLGTDIGLSF